MNNKLLILAVAVIVIVGVGVFLITKPTTTNTSGSSGTNEPSVTNSHSQTKNNTQVGTQNVNLTADGFQPSEIKIKAGSTVVWTNNSGIDATVNSDPHPTHFLWPFLNLGNFSSGENLSAIFDKPGKYTYHNHLNPNQKGTVIIE